MTNAYTESANGLAKDYEQGGPRLCVRRHPCRVLYGPDPVDPTEFVQCEHCGIRFAAGMLVSQEPVTIGRGSKKQSKTLCPNCYVFHTRLGAHSHTHSPHDSGLRLVSLNLAHADAINIEPATSEITR